MFKRNKSTMEGMKELDAVETSCVEGGASGVGVWLCAIGRRIEDAFSTGGVGRNGEIPHISNDGGCACGAS